MKQNKWCIKANSLEEAKVLFPFFNKESEKYGKNWNFDIDYLSHRDYYVYTDCSNINHSKNKPKGFNILPYEQFVSIFINKIKIYELW